MHVYSHASDDALLISELTKNDRKRLGRHGPKDLRIISPRTVVADCSDLKGSRTLDDRDHPTLVDAINALRLANGGTPEEPYLTVAEHVLDEGESVPARGAAATRHRVFALERLFDHWGYLHRPEVIADIYEVLKGRSASRIPGRETRPDGRYRLRMQ